MSTETAEPITWLDAETVEELQPPCDYESSDPSAAGYLVALCPKCGMIVRLYCQSHYDRFARILSSDPDHRFNHYTCGRTPDTAILRMGRL